MALSFEFDDDWQTKRVRCDQWPESFAMWWLVAALYKKTKVFVDRSEAICWISPHGYGHISSNWMWTPRGFTGLKARVITSPHLMEFSPLTWVYSYLFNSYIQIGVKKTDRCFASPFLLGILVTSHSKVHWRCCRSSAHPKASNLPRGVLASLMKMLMMLLMMMMALAVAMRRWNPDNWRTTFHSSPNFSTSWPNLTMTGAKWF